MIEKELGRPIGEIFDSFDMRPIVAASLGQVHRAVLNGKDVAVKVQRTGLDDLFKNDLQNLKFAAKVPPKAILELSYSPFCTTQSLKPALVFSTLPLSRTSDCLWFASGCTGICPPVGLQHTQLRLGQREGSGDRPAGRFIWERLNRVGLE